MALGSWTMAMGALRRGAGRWARPRAERYRPACRAPMCKQVLNVAVRPSRLRAAWRRDVNHRPPKVDAQRLDQQPRVMDGNLANWLRDHGLDKCRCGSTYEPGKP